MKILLFYPAIRTHESPRFLFAKKKWTELHSALKDISHVNQAEEWEGKFYTEVFPGEHKINDEKTF